jgi:hypothetical protein
MTWSDDQFTCDQRGAPLGGEVFATAVEDDGFYAAWMRVACALAVPVAQSGATAHPVRRTVHTPAERRRLHPSVVSRLRLAQRFSRRELRDVPHA